MKEVKITSAGTLVANALVEEILRREDGAFLGSEDELVEKLGVSRATLRQAARLLEYQQLLTIKRGWHGGYFGRKPDTTGVTHMAAIVLRSHGADRLHTIRMMKLLYLEAVRLACACEDKSLWKRLEALIVEFQETQIDAHESFAGVGSPLIRHIGVMTGDPVISMFINILLDYAHVPKAHLLLRTPERRDVAVESIIGICRAMLRKNTAAALQGARRQLDIMTKWAIEDNNASSDHWLPLEAKKKMRRRDTSGKEEEKRSAAGVPSRSSRRPTTAKRT